MYVNYFSIKLKNKAHEDMCVLSDVNSLAAQLVENLPAMWETWFQSLGREDPLEKGKATYSSVLAWRIPWTVVHGVAKSWTRLNDFYFHLKKSSCTYAQGAKYRNVQPAVCCSEYAGTA